jgi:pimeloyl-ACP methyl ester carboxylesterase
MLEAIEKRELIVLEGLGARVHCTFHHPADLQSDAPRGQSDSGRLGVVFVNSLTMPRTATGDSAVHWANCIAELGYPTFRIDLPGLGDSEGVAGVDLLDSINAGGYADVTAAAARQLVERFRLPGVIILGHCAGSVSALYASALSKECKGLILLDPYFHLPVAKKAAVRQTIGEWVTRTAFGRVISNVLDRVRKVRLALRGSALPANANTRLLARWKQAAAAGLPILLLRAPGFKAQGAKPRLGEFDYIGHVLKLAGRKNRIVAEFVEGADHSFANRAGRIAVERHITGWLAAHFPLADLKFGAAQVSAPRSSKGQKSLEAPQKAPADNYCAVESR